MRLDEKLARVSDASPAIDSQRLLSLCAGKPDVLIQCLELLIAEVASNRLQVDQALAANDARALGVGVHNLRGSMSLIGAAQARDLAAAIENDVDAGDVRTVANQWQKLDRELNQCMANVRALLRALDEPEAHF